MIPWIARAVALVAVLFAAPAGGVTLDYTSFHVLGDSLSDTGNVYRATFGRTPKSPPYWRGRFSNGPVWAEHVGAKFRAAGKPVGYHAWGGAKATGGVTDLAIQASRYRLIDEKRRGARPMLALVAGANDIRSGIRSADIAKVGRRAANAVGDAAASLSRAGVRDLLVFKLPNLGKVPRYALNPNPSVAAAATVGAQAFNLQLDLRIARLRERGLNVHMVDTYALFDALIADPRSFGLRNTTTPCLDANDRLCTPKQARYRAFFDRTHPNFVVHRRLAEAVLAEIAAPVAFTAQMASVAPASVPLPAPAVLLLGSLLALGLVARRRRAEA